MVDDLRFTPAGARTASSPVKMRTRATIHCLEPQHPVDLSTVFTDVSTDDWFYSYVYDLYMDGVVNGYSNHTFRPSQYVTTGEALKMILLAAGFEEPERVASHGRGAISTWPWIRESSMAGISPTSM